MNTPITKANKLGGAYQCCMCLKTIDSGPMLEMVVNCGRNRKTRVWVCVEHILGVEALKCQAIADNMRSSDHHRMVDEKRRSSNRTAILASRFSDPSIKKTDSIHDFVQEGTSAAKRRESSSDSFVQANTLTARLGIPKDAVASLVESMGIVLVDHNGSKSIKNDDFMRLSDEVRRRSIQNRRGAADIEGDVESDDSEEDNI